MVRSVDTTQYTVYQLYIFMYSSRLRTQATEFLCAYTYMRVVQDRPGLCLPKEYTCQNRQTFTSSEDILLLH
jgi:hypothetical protein